MKELSIEEKAKAYDEALEKARQLCAYPTTKPFISDLQDIFPELKESEDEKVRKAILELVRQSSEILEKKNQEQMLAWLEKKGEQKPAEWSEDDEKMLQNILECLRNGWKKLPTDILKYESWLKSLRPQSQWKPSEEQIVALKHASNDCSIAFADMKILATLYEQLKALHHYEQDT